MDNAKNLDNFWTPNILDSFWMTFFINFGLQIGQDLIMSEYFNTTVDCGNGIYDME